jgi:hypothetical protein
MINSANTIFMTFIRIKYRFIAANLWKHVSVVLSLNEAIRYPISGRSPKEQGKSI